MPTMGNAGRIRNAVLLIGNVWLVIVLCIAAPSVHGQQNEAWSNAELFFGAPGGATVVGEQIELRIEGAGLRKLYAYELKLEYDANRVRIESATSGVGGRGYPVLQEYRQEGHGMLTFAYTLLGSETGLDGNATLLKLKLSTVAEGQAEIRLVSAKLIDSELRASYWNERASRLIAIGRAPTGGDGGTDDGSAGVGGDMPSQAADSPEQSEAWNKAGFRYQLTRSTDGSWTIELLERLAEKHYFTLNEELLSVMLQAEPGGEPVGKPFAFRAPIRLDWRQLDAAVDAGDGYSFRVPLALLQQDLRQPGIELILPAATVVLPGNMFGADVEADPSDMAAIVLHIRSDSVEWSLRVGEADWPANGMFHNDPLAKLAYKLAPDRLPYEHQMLAYYRGESGVGQGMPVASSLYDANRGELRFKLASPGTYTAGIASASFADLAGVEWARRSIELLAARGIVHGYGDMRFQPEAAVTRAEFVHMLAQTMEWHSSHAPDEPTMAGEPNRASLSNTVSMFADVPENAYYWSSLLAARAKNVVLGTERGQFLPEATLQREDMFVLAARAMNLEAGMTGDEAADVPAQFRDKEQLSGYAVNAAASLITNGLIRGSLAGLEPLKVATRAEAAVFLARLLEFMHQS